MLHQSSRACIVLMLLTCSTAEFTSLPGQSPFKKLKLPSVIGDLKPFEDKLRLAQSDRRHLRALMGSPQVARRVQSTQDSKGQGVCQVSLLQFFPPPAFLKFEECLHKKMESIDTGVVGAGSDIAARCWCDSKVKESVDALGCCTHPDFKHLCEMKCNPDCQSAEAQKCLDQCPPICLEPDLAPPSCMDGCASGECHKHLLCITEHSKNQTQSGALAKTCDEKAFAESAEMSSYVQCQTDFPRRTYWQRKNSQMHCACKHNLAQALSKSTCCDASWATGGCSLECASDCSTPEATACLDKCRNECKFQGADAVVTTCYDKCLKVEGECHRYSACPPLEQLSFDYVCDAGELPAKNGCCQEPHSTGDGKVETKPGCPALCDSRQVHMLPHGPECLCSGCPKDEIEARKKMEVLLEEALWANGQELLVEIAHLAELKMGPTPEMQRLMAERNEKLKESFLASANNVEGEQEMIRINDEYVMLIVDAAKAAQKPDETLQNAIASGDKKQIKQALKLTEGAGASADIQAKAEAKVGDIEETEKKEKESSSQKPAESEGLGIGLVVAIIAGVMITMSIGFAVIWFKSKKNQDVEPIGQYGGAAQPANGPTVVVGQPVNSGAGQGDSKMVAPQGTVQGAPMATKS